MKTGSRIWPLLSALALAAMANPAAAQGASGGGRAPTRPAPLTPPGSEATRESERSTERQVAPTVESAPPRPGAAGGTKIPSAQSTTPGKKVPPVAGRWGGWTVQPPGSLPSPSLPPRLSQKLVLNLALRFLLDMRVTDQEIAGALPLLKEMRAAETALETECEQALEADNQALLAARPGSAVATENRERWRQALASYLEQDAELWRKLSAATNDRTAKSLRSLLGRGGTAISVSASATAGRYNPLFNPRSGPGVPGKTVAPGGAASAFASSGSVPPQVPGDPFALERRLIRPDPVSGLQPRLSLTELIDLLERKQQAMPPSP